MVDPNPARGMPAQLKRYWLAGKGALKIRWGTPGDFNRCVRALRAKFPENPQGLCNILHTQATGHPPGEHSLREQEEAQALLAAAPMLGNHVWIAPLAPIGRRTGDGRMFLPDALTFRTLPLPLEWVKSRTTGHQGAITVGRILGVSMGPDDTGDEYAWGWGDLFDPAVIPEVAQALALIEGGVAGLSLDPGGMVRVRRGEDGHEMDFLSYKAGGATLVSIPAFEGQYVRLATSDDEIFDDLADMPLVDEDCGCAEWSVGVSAEEGFDQGEDARDDQDHDDKGVGFHGLLSDVGNAVGQGKQENAAQAEQGAEVHGLLPAEDGNEGEQGDDEEAGDLTAAHGSLVSEEEVDAQHEQHDHEDEEEATDGAPIFLDGQESHVSQVDTTLAVNTSGWQGLPIADRESPVDRDDAIKRIAAWSGGDPAKLNRAFLWRHPEGDPNSVYSYRLPIGDIINGKLTLIYHAIYAASALLEGAHGGLPNIPGSEKESMRRVISAIYRKLANTFNDPTIKASWDRETKRSNGVTGQEDAAGDKEDMALTDLAADIELEELAASEPVTSGGPIAPPASWFDEQSSFPAGSPVTITRDGQFTAWLAPWRQCHRSVGRGSCVRAPRSVQQYGQFHLGSVLTDEGGLVRVGKVTLGGGHADTRLGLLPAIEHYDNAGTAVVVVRAHETEYGIQLAGAIVPEATPAQVANLRRSPLSGDWRNANGNLELVAALAVNTPGFPVFATDTEDMPVTLVASLMDAEDHEGHEGEEELAVDIDQVVDQVVDRIDERTKQADRNAALLTQQEWARKNEQNRRAEKLRALTNGG